MLGARESRNNLFGNQSYATLSQRNAHPLYARKQAIQEFYVEETGKTYKLVGGITNNHWEEVVNVSAFPTPFTFKKTPVAGETYEHEGTVPSFLQNIFAPYLVPTISLTSNPTVREVGVTGNFGLKANLNDQGEAETTFRDLVFKLNGAEVNRIADPVDGNNNYTGYDNSTVTSARTDQYRAEVLYSGGGKTDQLIAATRNITWVYPYFKDVDVVATDTLANVIPDMGYSRWPMSSDQFDISYNHSGSGSIYLYFCVPATKALQSIEDLNDNGAAIPISVFTMVEQGLITVPVGGNVIQEYSFEAKLYRSNGLGPGNYSWRLKF